VNYMSKIQNPKQVFQMLTVCRYELLKFIRGKKILGIIAITFAISIPIILLPEFTGTEYPDTIVDFFSFPLSFGFFLMVLTGVFFGGDSLVSEFHQRTGYTLFTNPVSRTTIWLGKFLAAELVSFLVIVIYYGIISSVGFVIYDGLKIEVLFSLGISFLVVTMIMSMAFLISSFLKGPTGVAVLIFFLFIVIFPMIDQLLISIVEIKPWFTPSFSASVVENIIIVPYPSDIHEGEMPRGPFDFHPFVAYVENSLAVMISYIVASSALSIFIFKNKELS